LRLQKSFTIISIIYYINVKLPNLDLKLGIKPKAGNFLSGKSEGEGGGERLRFVDR
jgi:hypothetical protein